MKHRKIFLIFFIALWNSFDICENKEIITVVANKLLRINKPYRVFINYREYNLPTLLQIGIVHDSQENLSLYKNITIDGDGSESIEFLVTDFAPGDHKLKAKTLNGSFFNSQQSIEIVRKNFTTLIQTDKSVYKPADKVQFRVLLLDADTRPYYGTNVDVFITDGGDNRVKQFDKPKFIKGVFQNEFKLSDLPVMGEWKINVKVDDEKKESKIFKVAEYVLPKFEFKIDANTDANLKDGKITVKVSAKYTFGKKAKGNVTITAGVGEYKKISRTIDIDGKEIVEFDIKKDFGMKLGKVTLVGSFTEELTGKEQNATTEVEIHETPYKIVLKKLSDTYKPNLPYRVTAIVNKRSTNSPISDAQKPVECKISLFDSFGYSSYKTLKQYSYSKNGFAEFEFEPFDAKKIEVQVTYQETSYKSSKIRREENKKEFLQIIQYTKTPKIDQPIEFKIESTSKMNLVSYQVVGSATVINSKSLTVPNEKTFEFSFIATDEMAPESYVIVYYVTQSGHLVSDKKKIILEKELKNSIDIQISPDQVKPGEELSIKIKSTSDSFIGLLGVDQSVLILKEGNDIKNSDIIDKLKIFNEKTKSDDGSNLKDFKDSSAVILTNANTYYRPYTDFYPFSRPPCNRWNSFGCGFSGYNPYYSNYNQFAYPISYNSPSVGTQSFASGYNSFGSLGGFGGSAAAASASSQSFGSGFNSFGMGLSASPGYISGSSSFEPFISEPLQEKPLIEKKPTEIRKEFPETWIFENIELTQNITSKIISKKAPDTITSWIITGFSVNPTFGLGITKEPSILNVFQPFFVSTNLPYSVKRGEVVSIPITVFNYMQTDQEVEIKIFNVDREFEFVEVNEEENEVKLRRRKRGLELERKKNIFVASSEGATVRFMIRSLKVGYVTIKVTAESNIAGDGIEQKLLVVPEGVTQFMNEAILIDLKNTSEFRTSIDIKIPDDAVENSTRIEAAISGDLLGPSIENLDKLIKLPYGCGEQNMVNFVPNIVVLDYLTHAGLLTPEVELKAKSHMESGYQRELGYKHNDGSYSAFGGSNKSGSTWLTAFVIKSFNQALKYIKIENEIIDQGLKFLSKTQKNDGSFPEVGYILASNMQGGASKGIGLTAYVLITFLESSNQEKYQTTIDKGFKYILENINDLNDTYSLAIASYALQLAKHQMYTNVKTSLLEKLNEESLNDKNMKYWKRDLSDVSDRPDSISIEMTSYALLAFIESEKLSESFSIGKWLVTQRNENGGFQSTQDTVVGLQALAKLASKVLGNNEMKITINAESKMLDINVNAKNSLILQKYEIPSSSRHFDITVTGQGTSLLQIAYRYNIHDILKRPKFTLEPKIEPASHKEYLHLTVCTKFVPDSIESKSNMAVMEITLPSGFTFDSDHMDDLKSVPSVEKVETKDSDTVIIVYFDNIDVNEICPDFKAFRTHGVAKQKPSPIVIYDYYDNSRSARVFYNPPEVSLCDICGDEEECQSACETGEILTDN